MGYGANLNAQTLDGDTPLHLILSETKQIILQNVADMPQLIKVTDIIINSITSVYTLSEYV